MSGLGPDARRHWAEGSSLGAGVLLALVLFAMVNYLAFRHYQRFDWTESKLYTLSEKSENVVRGLDRDVDGIIFLNPGSELYGAVDELLSRYAAVNPDRFHKRVIDPAKNLLEARQLVESYGIDRDNVVVLVAGEDRRVIDELDLAEYDYSGAQFGQPPTLQAFKGEQLITSAILELVEARKPKLLFVTGHGEAPLAPGGQVALSQARDLLGKDNFTIEEWGSLGKDAVPPDTDLLVVAGPASAFLAPELAIFSRYLASGGRMLLFIDPLLSSTGVPLDAGLGEWLAGYGVELGNDVVVDPSQKLPFFGPETIFTDAYGVHPIVEALADTRTPVMLPLARSVSPAETAPEGKTVTQLVETSDAAWAETGLDRLQEAVAFDEGEDRQGPISLGVAVSFSGAAGAAAASEPTEAGDDAAQAAEGRLVVYGDIDFASDTQLANGGNSNLLLNTFNWLVQREELIAIEPRRPEQTRLNLAQDELSTIYLLVLVLLPGLTVALGVFVYLRRRR